MRRQLSVTNSRLVVGLLLSLYLLIRLFYVLTYLLLLQLLFGFRLTA